MTAGVTAVGAVKAGLCPHGLPPGACPICSGMGGGSKVQTADFSAKPGEMSWNECAAIGAFLKSLQNARMAKEADFQQRLINIAQFEANMAKSAERLNQFIQTMSQNVFTKPLAVVAQKVLLPIVQGMKNLPVNVLNTFANIAGKLADISDKLTAVYGELKAAVNKKISDLAKVIKRKIKSIFNIFMADNESDENEIMVAFEKQLDKLKTLLEKVSEKLKKDSEQLVEENLKKAG
jgi:ribosome-associated translation inhibitor RaiA